MDDLIEALTILRKYVGDTYCPTHCEHDIMMVLVDGEVDEDDHDRLAELSFHPRDEYDGAYCSYRFGSA